MKIQIDQQLFFEVMSNGEYRCGYCGTDLNDKSVVPDYKTPRSLGGEGTSDNLLAVCKDCSKLKGHRTVEEFRAAIFEGISEMIDKAYTAYEKMTPLLDDDTDGDVRRALVNAKTIMKRKAGDRAVVFFFERMEIAKSKIEVMPLVETEVRQ